MGQGAVSPSLGQGSSGDVGWEPGKSRRRNPTATCSAHQRLRYPSWCGLVLPERSRNASPLQASQYVSEIGLQQKLINGYQCHWPGKIKIEERQVSYAMFLVAVCKGNISFIDFAVWNGNV